MLLDVNDVMKILKVSQAQAYRVIRNLNKNLEKQGFYTLRGRVPKKFLFERFNIEN